MELENITRQHINEKLNLQIQTEEMEKLKLLIDELNKKMKKTKYH